MQQSNQSERKNNTLDDVVFNFNIDMTSLNNTNSETEREIIYTPDNVEINFGIDIVSLNNPNSENVAISTDLTASSTLKKNEILINSQVLMDNQLPLISQRKLQAYKNFRKRKKDNLIQIADLNDNDAEAKYIHFQKIGQFFINFTYAYSNTVWYPFALIPTPYDQMVETLATPLNATIDHLLDALFLTENPLSSFKTQELIKNFVCNTTSLALVGGLGFLFGKYVVPDSESYALQFLALYLNQTGVRRPFLYTIGYFGNCTFRNFMSYSWERFKPVENKPIKEHPKLNSGQQLGRYSKRGELPIAIINYLAGDYSIETRFWMIKSIESILRPGIYFSFKPKPVKNLNVKRGFIEQCGAQYLPENLDENKEIIVGAFLRTTFYTGFALGTYAWMQVVNYNYPEMYKNNPNLFYSLSYGLPVWLEFLSKNTGEMSSDFKIITNQVSRGVSVITTSLSFCSSSFFKGVKNIKEILSPNNEETIKLLK